MFDGAYARVDQVDIIKPTDNCSDGPCIDWCARCGQGCVCTKYETTATEPGYLSALAGSRIVRTYGLRCR